MMDEIDEIDETHPESTDAFAAYIAEGGIDDKDRLLNLFFIFIIKLSHF